MRAGREAPLLQGAQAPACLTADPTAPTENSNPRTPSVLTTAPGPAQPSTESIRTAYFGHNFDRGN